jgi:pimeloyl-ACP methyl ester carboxylesterase
MLFTPLIAGLSLFTTITMATPTPQVAPQKQATTGPESLHLTSNPWSTAKLNVTLSTGENIFYREAGSPSDPTILLLHGFPASSFQYRNMIPILASHGYHVLAPDFPGFGFTVVPDTYNYTFENLANSVGNWLKALPNGGPAKYAMYIFDYGAPVGLRLAMKDPSKVTAIVSQNGNAYEAGLLSAWDPIKAYWADNNTANRNALEMLLTPATTQFQYTHGTQDLTKIDPATYSLDSALLARPGQQDIQLNLFYDYRTNVAMYRDFQKYFRDSQVPLLAVWGNQDPFFGHPELFKKDLPNAEVHEIDAGHFAVESNLKDVAGYMVPFLEKVLKK